MIAFRSAGPCVCLDEQCGSREIPADFTQRYIDRDKAVEVTNIRCPSCNKQWRVTRKLYGGNGAGEADFELVTDPRQRQSFDRKREALFGAAQVA